MDVRDCCCEHDRPAGACRWCDRELYDTTCWYCAGELRVNGVIVGRRPVHKRCKAKAEKYLRDTG